MQQPVRSVNELLERDPIAISRWIQQIHTGQKQAPGRFNWLGLAEVATTMASSEQSRAKQQDLVWAHIGLAAYSYLIEKNASERDSVEEAMMHLRALVIRRYGTIAHDPLQDIDQIVSWFFAHLPFTLAEAQIKIDNLLILPDDDLLELRRIKNRLNIIVPLVQDRVFEPDEELQNWLESREKLP